MNGTGGHMGGEPVPRLDLVAEMARQASGAMTTLQRMEGLRLVSARLQKRRRQRTALLALSLLSAASATAGSVLLVRWRTEVTAQNHVIAYSIKGGEIGDGGYIRSLQPTGSLLQFEEGTEVRLMTGARGRLSSVDGRGARFAIEEGEAEVKVTPKPGARWLVDAGPFLITVRGTVFRASWNGATERLDIQMKKGLVSVTGPFADGMMAVSAGQHLSVNVKTSEVLLRQIDGEAAEESPAAAAAPSLRLPNTASAAVARAAPRSAGTGRGERGERGERGWSAALAAGDLDSILRDAERQGLRRAIAHANSDDLAALADAARYRRRDDIARPALLAARERFPRSVRASDSAFLLGRLEEARPDGEARALRWYDLYLKEAPSGAYSSEALGRKMTALGRSGDGDGARQVAREYLRRYPDGTYAGAARALRATP